MRSISDIVHGQWAHMELLWQSERNCANYRTLFTLGCLVSDFVERVTLARVVHRDGAKLGLDLRHVIAPVLWERHLLLACLVRNVSHALIWDGVPVRYTYINGYFTSTFPSNTRLPALKLRHARFKFGRDASLSVVLELCRIL